MTSSPHSAIIYLGRPEATGEVRAVESWARLLEAAGSSVTRIPLMTSPLSLPSFADVSYLLRGLTVPEAAVLS